MPLHDKKAKAYVSTMSKPDRRRERVGRKVLIQRFVPECQECRPRGSSWHPADVFHIERAVPASSRTPPQETYTWAPSSCQATCDKRLRISRFLSPVSCVSGK